MLDEIHATNLGLIADATVAPAGGLTVITGETGTGKTLMLGALRLVRGDTASRDLIGPHGDSCEVAARFVPPAGDEMVVRRSITTGRSRAYVDGVPVTAGELTSTIGPLISIVSQHDQHSLTTSEGVRRIVDSMFDEGDSGVLDAYHQAYSEHEAVLREIEMLGDDRRGLERERDVLRFQIDEIETAGFAPGDEEALRSQLDRLRHVTELSGEVGAAVDALGETGADEAMQRALAAVARIVRMDADASGLLDRLEEAASSTREVLAELTRYGAGLDTDPAALDIAEARLSELSDLKRKYGATIGEIDEFAKAARARVDEIEALVEAAADIEQRHEDALVSLAAAATNLRSVRERHAAHLSEAARHHLRDLGFGDPVVTIEMTERDPTATGADRFRVLFASDASLTPAPISNIASGGELSRLVLALTLASGAADTAVVAFDEVDAGVGGSTALALGEKLAALASDRQVICVTHLPQVAAFADAHFIVRRSGTRAEISAAHEDERVAEITRMMAGLADAEGGKRHTEELLALAAAKRAAR